MTEKIRWLLILRLAILTFFLAATALFNFFQAEGSPRFFFIILTPLLVAYGISIGSFLALPRVRYLRLFGHAQIGFD
ncbi:MAG TPA: hypothetical protein VFS84_10580, partial [Candidatus Binatia bacterium]|nr:hypothetical protein [Candidatus Binatia bacterium]